jgi:hypothetical protein
MKSAVSSECADDCGTDSDGGGAPPFDRSGRHAYRAFHLYDTVFSYGSERERVAELIFGVFGPPAIFVTCAVLASRPRLRVVVGGVAIGAAASGVLTGVGGFVSGDRPLHGVWPWELAGAILAALGGFVLLASNSFDSP